MTAWIPFLSRVQCCMCAADHLEDAGCDMPAFRDSSGHLPVDMGAMPGLMAFRLRDGSG